MKLTNRGGKRPGSFWLHFLLGKPVSTFREMLQRAAAGFFLQFPSSDIDAASDRNEFPGAATVAPFSSLAHIRLQPASEA